MTVMETSQIFVPYPEVRDLHVVLKMGGTRLFIHRGEGDAWVSGNYSDPSGKIPCQLTQEEGTLWVMQDRNPVDYLGLINGLPRLDLAFGARHPFTLTLESGGSDNFIEVGGLPLTQLVTKMGAGKLALTFSSPNPQAMSVLNVSGGAGQIELTNLANANFNELNFESGAGSFVLDFGGVLQRDAHARISAGLAGVELRIPATTAARIYSESALVSVNVGEGFIRYDHAFLTPAATTGTTPILSIYTGVAVGSLTLRLI